MLHTSLYWKKHFQHNLTKKRINWSIKPSLSLREKQDILYSLKAWQLGETSDGKHLTAAAERFSRKMHDPEYVDAIQLFIKEEQKHGTNLGAYIDLIGEKRARKDWGDTLFRKIRYFNKSMELWTITVIIVESAAQIFYAALRDATHCRLLQSICQDILIDEAHHIKFQNERMYSIFQKKSFYNKAISIGLYAVLFFGTMHAIWWGHRNTFKAGGIARTDFFRMMYYKFFRSMQFLHSEPAKDTKPVLVYSACR